ncbi:MAG TPA: hypothetical protein VGV93_14295 [Acidimicrobiales bacterium]|nr:hypothetical protein [Acidimicrobiales bacterium]
MGYAPAPSFAYGRLWAAASGLFQLKDMTRARRRGRGRQWGDEGKGKLTDLLIRQTADSN